MVGILFVVCTLPHLISIATRHVNLCLYRLCVVLRLNTCACVWVRVRVRPTCACEHNREKYIYKYFSACALPRQNKGHTRFEKQNVFFYIGLKIWLLVIRTHVGVIARSAWIYKLAHRW